MGPRRFYRDILERREGSDGTEEVPHVQGTGRYTVQRSVRCRPGRKCRSLCRKNKPTNGPLCERMGRVGWHNYNIGTRLYGLLSTVPSNRVEDGCRLISTPVVNEQRARPYPDPGIDIRQACVRGVRFSLHHCSDLLTHAQPSLRIRATAPRFGLTASPLRSQDRTVKAGKRVRTSPSLGIRVRYVCGPRKSLRD